MPPPSAWNLADWLNAGLLVVGFGTLVSTVWAARTSLKKQAALAEAALHKQASLASQALEHQTREAHLDRVWERRATLYLDFLSWLDGQDAEVANLSLREFERQMSEDMQHDQELFASFEGHEPIPQSPSGRMSTFVSLVDHLDPPRDLALRLEIFGSDDLRREFESYKRDILWQEFTAEDGVDAMVRHQEAASDRLKVLRKVIADEIDARNNN